MSRSLFQAVLLTGLLAGLAGCSQPPAPSLSEDEPLSLELALSTNTITVGDSVAVTLTAHHPASGHVSWDEPEHPALEVRERSSSTRPLDDGLAATRVVYSLSSFVPGTNFSWEGRVTFNPTNGNRLARAIPFNSVEVRSVLEGENAEPAGIKPPATWPGRSRKWIAVFVVVGLLALAAALLAARYMTRAPALVEQAPPLPPHEAAFRALNELRARQWIESLNIEPFYIELSDIVRHYLEDRFDLHAPEQTTEEFIREATSSRKLSLDHQHLTQEFLTQCDQVKFARHTPGRQDMEDAFAAAERLVRETKEDEQLNQHGMME